MLLREFDRLAAIDLVFLRQDNPKRAVIRTDSAKRKFDKLVDRYDLSLFLQRFDAEKHAIFKNYINLVNEIGRTLKGTFFEIVLHNVLNPIQSILAIQNSEHISQREVGDPSTRFVVEYVKHQGGYLIQPRDGAGWVSYPKRLGNGLNVKATTTPVRHPRYGLIGIVCVNVSIDSVRLLNAAQREQFFEDYLRITAKTPEFEK